MADKRFTSKSHSKGRYFFLPLSSDSSSPDAKFELYEDGNLLLAFNRKTFREDLRSLERGENWIGAILRLLSKKFPRRYSPPTSQQLSLFDRLGEDRLVEHLRSKGFRVVKNLKVPDKEIIDYLESKGYSIEGLLNDNLYRSSYLVFEEVS